MVLLSHMFVMLALAYSLSSVAIYCAIRITEPETRIVVDSPSVATIPPTKAGVTPITPRITAVTKGEEISLGRKSRLVSRRFPRYGTPEFDQACNWTTPTKPADCTLFARPANKGEGLSSWTTEIAAGFIYSLLTGCRLFVDYGPDIDFARIFAPPVGSPWNWTVPGKGYNCGSRCATPQAGMKEKGLSFLRKRLGLTEDKPPLLTVPHYRWSYWGGTNAAKSSDIHALQRAFPGFQLTAGMACAHGSLLELATSASEFEPTIHSKILPTLRNEENFVIALYIRTGRTDRAYKLEQKGERIGEDDTGMDGRPRRVVNCALELEKENFLKVGERPYSRVVWMVVSDSPSVGRLIESSFQGVSTEAGGVPREVLTTSSRGVQTEPGRNPSTADFAEGVIDWYLLGESDLIVAGGGVSFSATAAQRTVRPLYDALETNKGKCLLQRIKINHDDKVAN